MQHEGPGWSVHSPSASVLRGSGRVSMTDISPDVREDSEVPTRDGFHRTASREAAANELLTEKEIKRFKKGGLTTAEERETEILATVRDLSDRNEEMVRQLTLERQRASDLGHSVDRMTKELDAERVERKKFERESSHKGRELAWAHSLIQELRAQINEIEGRDESQQRVQAELLTLLEQQVHDGDKVVKELQEALVKSEIQIDTLKRDLAAERERRVSLDETNQTLRAQAGEDQRKTKILIKYKENASRQMAQQHEAVLKKLFESSEVLEREYADELEPGGVLGTSWPSGSSPLRRTVEAAAGSGGRVSRASTRDLSQERMVAERRGGTTQVKKETGGMKSYTELRMEKEAAERKLRLAQRQLKLVVYEHSKLLEKHRLMSSTKDTLLEELKTVRSAANIMERDLKEEADKMRTRSSHMEREAIFEREARARAVSECSWLREKLRSLHEKTEQLNRQELARGSDRAEILRDLKVRERQMESMFQAIQGLAQDMWLRMESEAKLTWSGLSEYRTALEGSARTSDDMRMNSHQEWGTVYQAVGQLVREFESGIHDKLVENASADVREAIRSRMVPVQSSRSVQLSGAAAALSASPELPFMSPTFRIEEDEEEEFF